MLLDGYLGFRVGAWGAKSWIPRRSQALTFLHGHVTSQFNNFDAIKIYFLEIQSSLFDIYSLFDISYEQHGI